MSHYRTTVSSRWDVATAFSYMANFANAQIWDPGVDRAHQLGNQEISLGTQFELVASFNGRQLPLTYEITVFEPPHRVVLRAETNMVLSVDEITFDPRGDCTDVTYDADLRTRGWFKVAAPVVALMFNGIGDRARVGLERELNV